MLPSLFLVVILKTSWYQVDAPILLFEASDYTASATATLMYSYIQMRVHPYSSKAAKTQLLVDSDYLNQSVGTVLTQNE
ncbi:hypothetical protein E2C01_024822 [Portunus trituberculatus]|uniref:Uncharacterized protein n=1 Tax=Portunus trituberculatus TaxID=210409 RepID=A0A5B7EDW3_PORTR|nr:hypothetical protein [Portunus trituberculatus]